MAIDLISAAAAAQPPTSNPDSGPTTIPDSHQAADIRATAYQRMRLLQQQLERESEAAAGEFRALLRAMWPGAACLVLCHSRKDARLLPDRLITADGTIVYAFDNQRVALPQAPEPSAAFADSDGTMTVRDLTLALRALGDAGLEYDDLDSNLRSDEDDLHDHIPCLWLSPDSTDSAATES